MDPTLQFDELVPPKQRERIAHALAPLLSVGISARVEEPDFDEELGLRLQLSGPGWVVAMRLPRDADALAWARVVDEFRFRGAGQSAGGSAPSRSRTGH